MAYLVLDIETVPRPEIDESVEEVIAKKAQAHIDRTGDDPKNAESLIRSTSPFFGQVLCVGMRWLQDDGSSRDKVVCESNEESLLRAFFDIVNDPTFLLPRNWPLTWTQTPTQCILPKQCRI